MNKKDVNKLVKESINQVLEKDGYKYVNWDGLFHKNVNDFTYKIGWGCFDRGNQFEIGFFVAIRNEKVTGIFNLFSRVQPKYQREVSNLTLPFAYFTGEQMNVNISMTVLNSTSKDDVINSFLSIYEEKVKSFFDEYSSLEKISSFMLKAIDNNDIYGDESSFYITSIIVLKLINSPVYFERTNSYKNALKEFSKSTQDEFNNVIEYLKSM